jgi:iron complex transport system substrate-binding protein
MSVRPFLRGVALLAATVLVTSCGSGDAETAEDGTASSSPSGPGAFPVTVETAFGPVTVEEEPERVVALGWGDAETALALGVQPVGASDWLAFGGTGVGPWAQELYDEAPEIVDTLEPSLEAVAALEPDLILDTRSSGAQDRHEALSQIAPTIGPPEGVGQYQTTWQQQLDLAGQALGRSERADELQVDVEQQFADARAQYPEFEGTEVAVAAYTSEGFGAYVRGDARVDFMESLGFVNEPAIQDLAGDSFFIPISEEQVPLLDAPLTVVFPIFVDAAQITSNPLWQSLPSVQQGDAVVLEDQTLVNAFSSASVLGIQYALENAVPVFAQKLAP